MCFVWISEQTATFAFYIINKLVFITEVESVYCAVCTESYITQIHFLLEGLIFRVKQSNDDTEDEGAKILRHIKKYSPNHIIIS